MKFYYFINHEAMLFTVLQLALFSCGSSSEGERPHFPPYDFHYDLTLPDAVMKMPSRLKEISGLGLSADGRYLIAVQDERGIIFFVEKTSGKLVKEISFQENGDYEGVEVVGTDVYVVKSTGTLYRIQHPGEERQSVDKYNFFLGHENDVEGLAYDSSRNRLLLACKGEAGDGKEFSFKRGIYAFDLATSMLDSVPAYLISLEDVQAYLDTSPTVRKLEKLLDTFSPEESEFVFSPSGLAIHPLTGDFYLLSSVGKLLMVMSAEGEILHIEKLKKEVHAQPEGICFDADGTLYISNEASGGEGLIYRFAYRINMKSER